MPRQEDEHSPEYHEVPLEEGCDERVEEGDDDGGSEQEVCVWADDQQQDGPTYEGVVGDP